MKLSIRLKLLIGFTSLLLIAAVVQGAIFVLTKNYVSAQIDNIQKAEVNRGASAITDLFTDLRTNSQGLAQIYQKEPQAFDSSAKYLINTNNYIRRITVLSPHGKEIEKIDLFGRVSADMLSYEVASEPFTKASEGTSAYSKVYYAQKESAPYLDVYAPVLGPNASVSGVIKMKVNLHQVQEEISDIKLGENGYMYVVDDEGRLIAHPSEAYILERPNLASRKIIANALMGKQSTSKDEEYTNEKDVAVVASAIKIPGLNWIAVLEQPQSETYGFLTTLWQLFVGTFAGSMIVLLLAAFVLSENLTRSIRKLQQSAQQIESGQSKKTVIIKSGDEIESLSKSFASMTDLLLQRDQWLEKMTLKLNSTNEKLKEMDKLKDDFVSVASHELRTPMTAIKSYLSMALDGMGGPLTEKQRFYIDRAYISSDRLIDMVNDMLNISRIESGRLTLTISKVEMDKMVQEVIDDVGPRAAELGVTVESEIYTSLPPVIADKDKIKEVLFNLVGNSLKFTPKGGQIVISCKVVDSMLEVKVSDTGSGIEADDLSKLFHKFGLLPGSYKTGISGTGLGLYICKSIIELHEGKIYATSLGRDKGSQFVFTLKLFNDADLKRLSDKFVHNQQDAVDLIPSRI